MARWMPGHCPAAHLANWTRKPCSACSTFPESKRTPDRLTLVTENLAACANIIPAVESIYHWRDKIENAQETLVFFKTTAGRYDAFQDKLKSLHPYEVPNNCLHSSMALPTICAGSGAARQGRTAVAQRATLVRLGFVLVREFEIREPDLPPA